jgi:hypothetical protein
MKNLKKITALFLIILSIIGCSKSDPEPVVVAPVVVSCDSSNTLFNQLYNQTDAASTIISNRQLYDLKIYEYTFNVNSSKTICSIGLSAPANNTSYTIEIFNKTSGVMSYTGVLVFNTGITNYQTITPTQLVVGNEYIIRRKASVLGDTITRGLGFGTSSIFPVTLNGLTITDSDIYDPLPSVRSFTNKSLPFIDIVFQ